ncbi:hypothetical protein GGR53DRAFT_471556 [Hypoxylon sp. FL1150]|nr:hypothetical protein GGR53DRAFT_471556 [Hypoxylon sp. FL1150]
MLKSRRSRQATYVLLTLTAFSMTLFLWPANDSRSVLVDDRDPTTEPPRTHREVELVIASTTKENPSWAYRHFSHWNPQVYVTDNQSATLTVPRNKGHEAMVYLTYIIDHYNNLPDSILFIHASRFQWHNDDPDYDIVPTLRNLQFPYLRESGYVNLRCAWAIGCPSEIRPFEDEGEAEADGLSVSTKSVFRHAFRELLPEVPVPAVVAVSCCSQFGVARETVQRHPRERYLGLRSWLLETPLDDAVSGRVLEFSWHIVFGRDAVHCPAAGECYCKVFGQCGLACSESSCDGRYVLPSYSTLPEGWPRRGWDREDRGYTGSLD